MTTAHASGFYGHYNYFANLLLGILFPCLGLGLLGRRPASIRLAWLLAALVSAAGIVMSQSRGAWVGVAAVPKICWTISSIIPGSGPW